MPKQQSPLGSFAKPLNVIITLIGVLVVAAWIQWFYFGLDFIENAGLFGDKFGALNTLFTGLGFVGFIAAFWHERADANKRESEQKEVIDKIQEDAATRAREHSELIAAMKDQVNAAIKADRTNAIIAKMTFLDKWINQIPTEEREKPWAKDGLRQQQEAYLELTKISGIK